MKNFFKIIFPYKPNKKVIFIFYLISIFSIFYPFVELSQINAISNIDYDFNSIIKLSKWVLLTSILSLFLTILINYYAGFVGSEISKEIIDNNIKNSISIDLSKKTKIIDLITIKITRYSEQYLTSLIRVLQSGIASICILFYALNSVAKKEYLALVFIITFSYLLFIIILRRKINSSEKKANESSKISLFNLDEFYSNPDRLSIRRKLNRDLSNEIIIEDRYMRNTHSWMRSVQNSPRILIEIMGSTVFLIFYLFYFKSSNGIKLDRELLLLLGTAYRLIPTFQMFYGSYMAYKTFKSSFFDIKKFISDLNESNIIKRDKNLFLGECEIQTLKINVKKINFIKKEKFRHINLIINRKDWTLIKGESGSGKSSLMKILIGINKNYDGFVNYINNKKIYNVYSSYQWWENIDYISNEDERDIFIDPVKFICNKDINDLGKNNQNKIIDIIERLLLNDFFKIKQEYSFEKRIKILNKPFLKPSKGQKQRLKIARSIWLGKEWLFMDEATNGLDKNTENKLFENIKIFYNKSLIVISHSNLDKNLFENIIKI